MSEQPRFELYGFWRSSATYRVRVALNLKRLHAREHLVNLDAGAQREAGFLAINPLGAIPALIDRAPGQSAAPITQSLAILEYLDEVQPAPPLLPADPAGRARVRSLAAMLVADTHPLITPRVRFYLAEQAGFDAGAWRGWQTQWFTTGLQAFERRLAQEGHGAPFCHGTVPGLADICLASILVVMRVFQISVADTPLIDRIMAACEADAAFAAADPRRQPGAPQAV